MTLTEQLLAGVATLARVSLARVVLLLEHVLPARKTIPVHPTLAAMLAEWRLSGWSEMMERQPEPDMDDSSESTSTTLAAALQKEQLHGQ